MNYKGWVATVLIVGITQVALVLNTYGQHKCDLLHDANWIWRANDTSNLQETTVQIIFNIDTFEVDTVYRSMEIGTQNSSMSDSNGNLLFYSNGCYIANAQDSAICGSDTLNPGVIFNSQCKGRQGSYIGLQSMFVIPTSDSIYYILHQAATHLFDPSFHSVTDKIYATMVNPYAKDNQGNTIEKNIPIVSDTNIVSGNFSACRHANGESWWVIAPDAYGNGFFRIRIDSSEHSTLEKQYIGDSTSRKIVGGQAKFSPDGTHYAHYHAKSGGQLFNFDRQSGFLSNPRSFGPVDSNVIIGGCEFSPSGKFLYVNTMEDVFQYDTYAANIVDSEVHLGHYDGYITSFGFAARFLHMERTPTGQIFMNSPNQVNVVHIIEYPDRKGLASSFKQHSLILPAYVYFSMPHFPNYRLGALGEPLCDTVMSNSYVEEEGPEAVLVFPNPCTESATFSWDRPLSRGGVLKIFDIYGRELQAWLLMRGTAHYEANMSELNSGVYFYHILEGGSIIGSGKVMVVH